MKSVQFLKTLNILYVEDDLQIREKVTSVFSQVFNNIFVAANGQEGYDKFVQCKDEDVQIDVIISDINMPKISGLEMIKKIRKLDKDVPFILTSAYSSSNILLEAIKYGVTHYAVKPINLKEVIMQIEDICETKYKIRIVENKNNELLEYMHIIDQVALVSKIDLDGNYTFVNDIFCHASGYNKNDLIGKNRNIITHNDMPKMVCDELWDTLYSGNKWNGKLKNIGKNNNEYFTKSTILPFYNMDNGEIVEYIEISFVITVDEKEKREFRKKVMQNIQETKRQNFVARKMIDELQQKLQRFKHVDILEETIIKEREKTKRFKQQNKYYEMQLSVVNLDKKLNKMDSNSNVQRISSELEKEKQRKNQYFSKASELKKELGQKVEMCEILSKKIKEQSSVIKGLKNAVPTKKNLPNDKREKIA